MSRISFDEIGRRVRQGLEGSFLAGSVRGVEVRPGFDAGDDSRLEVVVSILQPDRVDARAANELVAQLQLDLMPADDRFLAFRFSEAA